MLRCAQWFKWWISLVLVHLLIENVAGTLGNIRKRVPNECAQYDAKEGCTKNDMNRSGCPITTTTCTRDDFCLAVFNLSPHNHNPRKISNILYLNCWPEKWDTDDCPLNENETCRIVKSSARFSNSRRQLLHCCCKGKRCNSKEKILKMKIQLQQIDEEEVNNSISGRSEKFESDGSIAPEFEFRRGTVLYTAIVILVPLLAVCIFIIFSYWLWRRFDCCQSAHGKTGHEILLGGSGGSGAVTDETSLLGSGAVGPDGYQPGTLINLCQTLVIRSRGRYGCVWQSKMRGSPYNKEDQVEREVAVKIFPPQDRQSWLTEQEIYRLRGLNHPNILRFIGADQYGENVHAQLWIVTEYHPVGSVADYLRLNTVTWPQLLSILRSMAEGMRHLHEEQGTHKPSIAHRDLKSKNVLLKANLREACIADMGLALKFEVGQRVGDTHAQVGTRRYMAPEVLEGAIQFSRDSFLRIDTYAMALVMWELMTRCNFRETEHRRSQRSTSDGSEPPATAEDEEVEAEAEVENEVEGEVEDETDEGLAMLEGDSSPRSTPSHSPGGGENGRVNYVLSGAAPVYQLPFEAELGPSPTLEAMQDLVVQRKQRPKMNPEWRPHEGMSALWETLEECWDQDAEARLSAGLVKVRMEGLEAQLPTARDGRAADVLVRHALNRQRQRRDSSSSALGSSASSLHPLVPGTQAPPPDPGSLQVVVA